MYLVDHKNLEKMSAKAQTWKKCLLNRTNLRYIEAAKLGQQPKKVQKKIFNLKIKN